IGVGQLHRGVGEIAELALLELAVLQQPVVVDVAVGAARDHVLHAGGRTRSLGLALRQLARLVQPLLAQPLRHDDRFPSLWSVSPSERPACYRLTRSRTPANRSSSGAAPSPPTPPAMDRARRYSS